MKKNYKTLIILFSAINVFAQNNVIDKTSNNLTLDGNVEFIDKNLVQAESFYRKAISKDSLNNIASYNMANSFYKSGFNKEAINEYKSSIVKAKTKEDLHKSFHNLGDAFMKNKDYQNAVTASVCIPAFPPIEATIGIKNAKTTICSIVAPNKLMNHVARKL